MLSRCQIQRLSFILLDKAPGLFSGMHELAKLYMGRHPMTIL